MVKNTLKKQNNESAQDTWQAMQWKKLTMKKWVAALNVSYESLVEISQARFFWWKFSGLQNTLPDQIMAVSEAGPAQILVGKKVEVSLRLFDIFERKGVFIFLCESWASPWEPIFPFKDNHSLTIFLKLFGRMYTVWFFSSGGKY